MALSESQLCFNTASLASRGLTEAVRLGWDMGFRAVEFLAFAGYRHRMGSLAGFYWDRLSGEERCQLRELVEPFDRVALHAPFIEIHPLSPNPAVREVSRQQILVSLDAAAALRAQVVTTHAVGVPLFSYEDLRGELISLYRWLGDLAAEREVLVGIETGWPAPDQLADLVEAVDHPCVGVTVDVGHLLSALSPEDRTASDGPARYNKLLQRHVATVGPKIVHVHVHDVRWPERRDHAALGTGILDFVPILKTLDELAYQGLLSFELEEPSPETLRASREVLLGLLRKTSEE